MNWISFEATRFVLAVCAVLTTVALTGCNPVTFWQTQPGPSDSLFPDGRLAPCPEKPNCVSTQAEDRNHAIVPYTYSKPIDEAKLALRSVLEKKNDLEAVKIVKDDGLYLHVEFRSRVLKVVDDVEFLFDEPSKTLQFRSSSRFGYSDWVKNRKRMEDIRNSLLGKI